jgi:hypothetical protein
MELTTSQEDNQDPKITPQLSLAVFQFLSVNVEPFQERYLPPAILRRLIKKYDVIEDLRHKESKVDATIRQKVQG